MGQMNASYDPQPIPWELPRHAGGGQRGPGTANIMLTVTATDSASGSPVEGIVASNAPTDPNSLIDDPNDLHFTTNRPNLITLIQVTSHEVPPGHPPLFLAPLVRVSACGYDEALLELS